MANHNMIKSSENKSNLLFCTSDEFPVQASLDGINSFETVALDIYANIMVGEPKSQRKSILCSTKFSFCKDMAEMRNPYGNNWLTGVIPDNTTKPSLAIL